MPERRRRFKPSANYLARARHSRFRNFPFKRLILTAHFYNVPAINSLIGDGDEGSSLKFDEANEINPNKSDWLKYAELIDDQRQQADALLGTWQ